VGLTSSQNAGRITGHSLRSTPLKPKSNNQATHPSHGWSGREVHLCSGRGGSIAVIRADISRAKCPDTING